MRIKPLILVNVVLVSILLTSSFLVAVSTSEFPPDQQGKYSPWADLNDDGKIDIFDLVWMAGRYGVSGTSVNKTELLYAVDATLKDLLARIDELNNTLTSRVTNLEAQTAALEGQIAVLTTYIGTLQSQMAAMNASLLSDIASLNTTLLSEINYLNTTLGLLNSVVVSMVQKVNILGNQTIPINSTSSTVIANTTETLNWVDMTGMSVQISMDRPSTLLIIFDTEAMVENGPNHWTDNSIVIRALVGGNAAVPPSIYLTPIISQELGSPTIHRHNLGYAAYSYNFYELSVEPGSYTVKIQWKEVGVAGATSHVRNRTLTVIAFPTE